MKKPEFYNKEGEALDIADVISRIYDYYGEKIEEHPEDMQIKPDYSMAGNHIHIIDYDGKIREKLRF